jgi:hypothetical protein
VSQVRLVSDHVRQCRRDMPPAEMLARRAFRDRSMDDIGVLVVLLQQQHKWQPQQRRLEERRRLAQEQAEDSPSECEPQPQQRASPAVTGEQISG